MRKLNQISLILLLIVFSCSKYKNVNPTGEEIEFGISFSDFGQFLKSANSDTSLPALDDAKQIVLTIKTSNDEDTKYTTTKIDIFKMGEEYFSSKLSLVAGDYKLTEFFLVDSNDNTIFVAPNSGSKQAQNVDNPLPLIFSVSKDQITSVRVQLLATTGLIPEDFGLVSFFYSEVPLFSFLVNVSEIGQSDSLLTASIEITNGTYSYSQHINAIANNIVSIRDNFSNYNVLVTKDGYLNYEESFPIDSLKYYTSQPLTIELEKENIEFVTDIDGNVYRTVKIGEQIWMKENLKTTHYSDGSPLIDGTGVGDITGDFSTKYHFAYNDNQHNVTTHGRLYTWAAVMNDENSNNELPQVIQGVCPVDWHVPSDAEWKQLEMHLGMSQEDVDDVQYRGANEGSKLAGNAELWRNSVLEYNDAFGSSDFTALPTGYRYSDGSYDWFDFATDYWSSTEADDSNSWCREIRIMNTNVRRNDGNKDFALSVRCIKD